MKPKSFKVKSIYSAPKWTSRFLPKPPITKIDGFLETSPRFDISELFFFVVVRNPIPWGSRKGEEGVVEQGTLGV